ncbi:CRISPR-associated protein, Cas6 family [Rubrobacter xylanophilus DSM 9941]|uniref:CRISPR-associated endoribonuclease n=1 Tax=Rubrobacter xylanophilus (strain DSM 9941 / JCM 11954 / NBRC 16129 / PRD-1) TaxID=266117 RepID=Q1AZD0_RUBXD|nr:CRISPR-associated endoribonuclease Cas6 [Rubrobacter xylanophilus]ABG03248.1 CRISPR-associated protein, Cas6 family [Rubrobacter xylanophilus DSM 9941]
MRLKIVLSGERGHLHLPLQYNSAVQGFIYANLSRTLADRLHNRGHTYGQRRFKLFTFSRLFGRREAGEGGISFRGPVRLYLGSAEAEVLGSLAEHLLRRPETRLGKTRCLVEEVGVEPEPEVEDGRPLLVRALSPITAYTTLATPEGRKKTYYYSPQEEEWGVAILENIKRKVAALGWAADAEEDLREAYVRPRRVRSSDQKVLRFKGTVVKGWMGLYELKMPEPYFRLAYDTGLGSKNSQGFGMIALPHPTEGRKR